MIAALRTEVRKITTTRAWWINASVMFAYMVVMAGIMAASFAVSRGPPTKRVWRRGPTRSSWTRSRRRRRSTRWPWRWATYSRPCSELLW